jgi:hypothetical protein
VNLVSEEQAVNMPTDSASCSMGVGLLSSWHLVKYVLIPTRGKDKALGCAVWGAESETFCLNAGSYNIWQILFFKNICIYIFHPTCSSYNVMLTSLPLRWDAVSSLLEAGWPVNVVEMVGCDLES